MSNKKLLVAKDVMGRPLFTGDIIKVKVFRHTLGHRSKSKQDKWYLAKGVISEEGCIDINRAEKDKLLARQGSERLNRRLYYRRTLHVGINTDVYLTDRC